jgi:hypothetical protein
MKVYRINNDINRYQYFLTEREEDVLKLKMDCTPKEHIWNPPSVFIYMPKLKAGDFHNFSSDILISSPRATEALRTHFEMAGELLPLPYKGQVYMLLNVTMCIDCLNHEETEWLWDSSTNTKILPKRYVFHRNRFTTSRIFKIPETCRGEILVVDMDQGGDEEVRSVVERAKLRGLTFEEIWNDQE